MSRLPRLAGAAVLGALALPPSAAAQQPALRVPAAVPVNPAGPPTALPIRLTAAPGQPYVVLADTGGGPRHALGTTFLLDLGLDLVPVHTGTTHGVDQFVLAVPASARTGLPVFFQAVVADPLLAPRTGLAPSNGESTIPYQGGDRPLIERFDDPAGSGFTGTFDRGRRGVLAGGPVRRRVWQTVDPQGVPFTQPLRNPLNPYGARSQLVYRPRDLGGIGEPETIVAIRWRPRGPVQSDRFDFIDLRLGHTPVTPDYSIDPWTALPSAPDSGLDEQFFNNYAHPARTQTVYSGPYDIRPSDVTARGYLPFPALRGSFAWNGHDSLLVEFFVPPQQTALGSNGAAVNLMATSSPRPNARVVAGGAPGTTIAPHQASHGQGDNAMYDFEFEFLRVRTHAVSPWRATAPGADYRELAVARRQPPGTVILVEFRGADDPQGHGATAWSSNLDVADGHPYLQYRVHLGANPSTSAVPELDSLLITWR